MNLIFFSSSFEAAFASIATSSDPSISHKKARGGEKVPRSSLLLLGIKRAETRLSREYQWSFSLSPFSHSSSVPKPDASSNTFHTLPPPPFSSSQLSYFPFPAQAKGMDFANCCRINPKTDIFLKSTDIGYIELYIKAEHVV